MQAFTYASGQISETADHPIPQLGPRDILVNVLAAGLNPVDVKVTGGKIPVPTEIAGYDAVGIVEAVGSEATMWRIGDKIYGSGSVIRNGSYAEKWAVDERVVAKAPASLSAAEGASVSLVALTAWEGLFEQLKIDPDDVAGNAGKNILVLPGAGGTGSYIIQFAKMAGLTVITTASRPESEEAVLELGADFVTNHRNSLKPQLEALGIKEVDYIFNAYKTDVYWDQYADIIKPKGHIVSIVETPEKIDLTKLFMKIGSFSWAFMFSKTMHGFELESQGQILAKVAKLIDEGRIRIPSVDSLPWSLENLKVQLAKQESGKTIGKLTLSREGAASTLGGA
jgi:zinc-binding alcohol dehydrogenase family protein